MLTRSDDAATAAPTPAPADSGTAPAGSSPDTSSPEEVCEVSGIHPEAVEAARAHQVTEDDLTDLADIFQILASPSRLRIVEALAAAELCVCDLAEVVGLSQSAVSHHLRPLRQLRLVRVRKEGRMAFYRLDDEHVTTLFQTGMEHVRE
jgi:DNA-binding transcriptional ArsR family regulator